MKKTSTYLIATLSLLCGLQAQAAGTSIIDCGPVAKKVNGLQIKGLRLFISNEDPEAKMAILRGNAVKPAIVNLAYEGSKTAFEFIPEGSQDGDLGIFLKKKGNIWVAHVTAETVDTFSVLSCVQRK